VVQLFDSWAHHLSPAQFSEFSMPYAQRVMDLVKAKHPEVPLIFHANGGTGKLQRIQKECKADVIGLDWACDIEEARAIFGPDQTLQGNVDPMVLFGSEDVIREHVADVVAKAGPKHILGVGHGVVQGTPEGNVGVFCDAARASTYAKQTVSA
jgi:uroporphyrinogen decarboxylase